MKPANMCVERMIYVIIYQYKENFIPYRFLLTINKYKQLNIITTYMRIYNDVTRWEYLIKKIFHILVHN